MSLPSNDKWNCNFQDVKNLYQNPQFEVIPATHEMEVQFLGDKKCESKSIFQYDTNGA